MALERERQPLRQLPVEQRVYLPREPPAETFLPAGDKRGNRRGDPCARLRRRRQPGETAEYLEASRGTALSDGSRDPCSEFLRRLKARQSAESVARRLRRQD
jgi:hypothetical protein